MTLPPNFPRSGEDELLLDWWRSRGQQGLLLLEVRLGQSGPGDWPDRRRHKRLDGLHLPQTTDHRIAWWDDVGPAELARLIHDQPATVLESKAELNTDVLGQAVAGVDMLSRCYPRHGRLDVVATVWGPVTDRALCWVAARRGVSIHSASRDGEPLERPEPAETARRFTSVLDSIGGTEVAAGLLVDYLDHFDGGHFETYGVNASDRIGSDDLLAVTTLSMEIRRTTRSGITPAHAVSLEAAAARVSALLEQIPTDEPIETLTPHRFEQLLGPESAALELWTLLKDDIGMPRVARHKLLARKRPLLLPIRDTVTERLLGLKDETWQPWWELMRDPETTRRLESIRAAAGAPATHLGLLRVADILLWRFGTTGSSG